MLSKRYFFARLRRHVIGELEYHVFILNMSIVFLCHILNRYGTIAELPNRDIERQLTKY